MQERPPLIALDSVGLSVVKPVPMRILHPLNLTITSGESVAVIGPSGAGKTSLASIIGGLQPATEGSYQFDGSEIRGMPSSETADLRSCYVGFVFQNAHLIDERCAWRNVAVGVTDPTVNAKGVESRSRAALADVGLGKIADREASLLSGGERQRVAVGRAMVKRPRLVIADEPTGSLDQRTGQAVLDLLYSVTEAGTTLIMVTHDRQAAALADRTVRIVDGRLRDE